MDKRNTIARILNELENQLPLVEDGDFIETIKTFYPAASILPEDKNIVVNSEMMTAPFAASRETKKLLEKDKSPLLEIYREMDRGDILVVKSTQANNVIVENLSVEEEFRREFRIEKLDVIKGNFNVIKRKSVDLARTLDRLLKEES